jgi:hypothetical protein
MTTGYSSEAYTLNHWNKTNLCDNSCPDALPQANNLGAKPTHQCKPTATSPGDKASRTSAGDKCNTNTQRWSKATPSPIPQKQQQVVTNNTAKCAQSDMGMFWLHNPQIRVSEIFL